MPSSPDALRSLLADRIAILDGAMGTMVHQLGLDEQGFRGERFAEHHRDLKNCIDVLTLTQGDAIRGILLDPENAEMTLRADGQVLAQQDIRLEREGATYGH